MLHDPGYMMETLSLDDNRTLQAIGILADVIDGVSGPGVLDTVLVSRALRQVIATRSYPALDFASRAFSTLDADIKMQIRDDAMTAAHEAVDLRGRVAGFLSTPAKSQPSQPKPRPPAQAATGFLAALNQRARKAKR